MERKVTLNFGFNGIFLAHSCTFRAVTALVTTVEAIIILIVIDSVDTNQKQQSLPFETENFIRIIISYYIDISKLDQ